MKYYTGSQIKKIRKVEGLTQRKLSELTGLSQSLITKIENDNVKPSYESMIKIISILETLKLKKKNIDSLLNKDVFSINPKASVMDALKIMKEKGVSQIPVIEKGLYFGVVSEKSMIQNFEKDNSLTDYIDYDSPVVSKNTSYTLIGYLLKENEIVLVKDKKTIIGIISRQDWFDDQFK